mmetsp:Transcript_27586/g.71559  ORF Transcript_27586/g.71559 Transcript_27586/m.71559 type:complete len:216 (+) Transcript_27586:545-1192(+)
MGEGSPAEVGLLRLDMGRSRSGKGGGAPRRRWDPDWGLSGAAMREVRCATLSWTHLSLASAASRFAPSAPIWLAMAEAWRCRRSSSPGSCARIALEPNGAASGVSETVTSRRRASTLRSSTMKVDRLASMWCAMLARSAAPTSGSACMRSSMLDTAWSESSIRRRISACMSADACACWSRSPRSAVSCAWSCATCSAPAWVADTTVVCWCATPLP